MFFHSSYFQELADKHSAHSRDSVFFQDMEKRLLQEIKSIHNGSSLDKIQLGEIGEIRFPYFEMGNINSSHLFGLDELIIFSYYFARHPFSRKVLDLGANIGLHSLVLQKIGYQVVSYEPDPIHVRQFNHVMNLNDVNGFKLEQKAVSNQTGKSIFTRVLGNTTGSHLQGTKSNVYGELSEFEVETVDIANILENEDFDLVKMDVEGHEFALLERIDFVRHRNLDIILEIGSQESAMKIFKLMQDSDIPVYSQKTNWSLVRNIEDLPHHHSQGSAFISPDANFLWAG